MPRKQKISYENMTDNKVSFEYYNNNIQSDNSKNLNSKYKIVRKIVEDKLTDKQREVFKWYFDHNLNITKIAHITGKNKSTISRVLKNARCNIQKYMEYSDFRN